jgi:hypothetical protein
MTRNELSVLGPSATTDSHRMRQALFVHLEVSGRLIGPD